MNALIPKDPPQAQTVGQERESLRASELAQRKPQSTAGEDPGDSTVASYQRMANRSPQVQHLAQLQSTLDASPAVQHLAQLQSTLQAPLQRKEGRGGLPGPLKAGIESLSGMAMDDVKVHYNSSKPAQLQALAFAQGADIHLAPGQEKHLPHEAWHVVQQKQGRVTPTLTLKDAPINDDRSLEQEADQMGDRALQLQATGTARAQLQQKTPRRAWVSQRAVIQRLTYAELSPSQRAQVNALSENTYYRKARLFQQQVQTVAAGDPRGVAAVDALLNAAATANDGANPQAAAAIRAQLGGTLAAKLQFLATMNGVAANPFVQGAEREQIPQTKDFRPLLDDGQFNPQFEQPVPNGQLDRATVVDGKVRTDSKYAAEARAQKNLTGQGGSAAIHTIMQAAAGAGLSAGDKANLKIALFAHYLPQGYSLAEILKSADAGLAGQGGLEIDTNLAPLTEGEIGRVFPSYFLKPHFKTLLSQALYPADPGERNTALALMPADVRGWVQTLITDVPAVQRDTSLQPLLDLHVPRVLIETLPDNQLQAVTAFMTGPLNQGAYDTLRGIIGDRDALLLAGIHQLNDGGGDAEVRRIGQVAETLQEDFNVAVEGGHGFTGNQITEMRNNVVNNNQAEFGPRDAGVTLNPGDFTGITDAAHVTRALAIHDYTKTDYVRYSSLFSAPTAPISKDGALDNTAKLQMTTRVRALTSGLRMLPVFHGTVYTGLPSQQIPDVATLQQAERHYSPGKIYAPKSAFSTSKSVQFSAWIQSSERPHVAFVIDDIKTGRDIQLISDQPGEREVLFPPSARFVIVRVENDLTPRADDPTRFEKGALWVYMREVGSTDTAPDTQALDAEKQQAFTEEMRGRRFVDRGHYNEAERSYGREEALDRNAMRLQGGANEVTAPQHVYGREQFADWGRAADYLPTISGVDLTVDTIKQLHARAGGSLLGANAGTFRSTDVFATGGLGQGGTWIALTDAQLTAVQANDALAFAEITLEQINGLRSLRQDERDAHSNAFLKGLTDAHLQGFLDAIGAGGHVGLLRYPPAGEIDNRIAQFVTWFNGRKNAIQNPSAPQTPQEKVDAATEFAALAQRKFVSIHPFPDGNGRTSRLIMDLVMTTFQLYPYLLEDPNRDLFSSEAEWTQEVRNGSALTRQVGRKYGLV